MCVYIYIYIIFIIIPYHIIPITPYHIVLCHVLIIRLMFKRRIYPKPAELPTFVPLPGNPAILFVGPRLTRIAAACLKDDLGW